MATLGIEWCDAALRAASAEGSETRLLEVRDALGRPDWPAFAFHDGTSLHLGRSAEDQWFVHPRRVSHTFLARLNHEPSALNPSGKPLPFSELAYHLAREFTLRASAELKPAKAVLAVPGSYLKDAATEEEKVGLLLGIAGELHLPLAGVVDAAVAAMCSPDAPAVSSSLPVVVVELLLDEAGLTLLRGREQLARSGFAQLPGSGLAPLLRHLTSTMGNRFLRHTAFDILEDGRLEQAFFRQTKEFLLGASADFRYEISTGSRTYSMPAKRDQLAADSAAFAAGIVRGLRGLLEAAAEPAEPCTLALSHRAAAVPGLASRLQEAGFRRLIVLPEGAAATGAARLGERTLRPAADLGDVPVLTSVPASLVRHPAGSKWEARVARPTERSPQPPTHVAVDGVIHPLPTSGRISVGGGLPLPAVFTTAEDCPLFLGWESGQLALGNASGPEEPVRLATGDRVSVQCGGAGADLHVLHWPENPARRP
jgi:hypothetical protein